MCIFYLFYFAFIFFSLFSLHFFRSEVNIDKLVQVSNILARTLAAEMYGLTKNNTSVLHDSFLVSRRLFSTLIGRISFFLLISKVQSLVVHVFRRFPERTLYPGWTC